MLVVKEIIDAIVPNKHFGIILIPERKAGLRTICERLYNLKGMEIPNLDYMVDELEYKIAHSWPILTMPEIKLALEAGIQGEFKKVGSTISVANCIGWISEYFTCDERRAAREKIHYQESLLPAKVSLTEVYENNLKFELEGPQEAYDTFRREGRTILFAGYAAALYDALLKHGKINPTAETRERAAREAERTMRRTLGHGFASIAQKGANSPVFETYVKQELLYSYFENLKQRNILTIKIS